MKLLLRYWLLVALGVFVLASVAYWWATTKAPYVGDAYYYTVKDSPLPDPASPTGKLLIQKAHFLNPQESNGELFQERCIRIPADVPSGVHYRSTLLCNGAKLIGADFDLATTYFKKLVDEDLAVQYAVYFRQLYVALAIAVGLWVLLGIAAFAGRRITAGKAS